MLYSLSLKDAINKNIYVRSLDAHRIYFTHDLILTFDSLKLVRKKMKLCKNMSECHCLTCSVSFRLETDKVKINIEG